VDTSQQGRAYSLSAGYRQFNGNECKIGSRIVTADLAEPLGVAHHTNVKNMHVIYAGRTGVQFRECKDCMSGGH